VKGKKKSCRKQMECGVKNAITSEECFGDLYIHPSYSMPLIDLIKAILLMSEA
jgi:hypothetical protein